MAVTVHMAGLVEKTGEEVDAVNEEEMMEEHAFRQHKYNNLHLMHILYFVPRNHLHQICRVNKCIRIQPLYRLHLKSDCMHTQYTVYCQLY